MGAGKSREKLERSDSKDKSQTAFDRDKTGLARASGRDDGDPDTVSRSIANRGNVSRSGSRYGERARTPAPVAAAADDRRSGDEFLMLFSSLARDRGPPAQPAAAVAGRVPAVHAAVTRTRLVFPSVYMYIAHIYIYIYIVERSIEE